jgi:hypothetical protein
LASFFKLYIGVRTHNLPSVLIGVSASFDDGEDFSPDSGAREIFMLKSLFIDSGPEVGLEIIKVYFKSNFLNIFAFIFLIFCVSEFLSLLL